MMYDFYGFPDELYRLDYPAKIDPELINQAIDLLDLFPNQRINMI